MDPILGSILASTLGSMFSGLFGKPDIPKNPSIGMSPQGNQNPQVMQMLSALMGNQAQQGAQNRAGQQQQLQQMLMAMMLPQIQSRIGTGSVGQVQPLPQGQTPGVPF